MSDTKKGLKNIRVEEFFEGFINEKEYYKKTANKIDEISKEILINKEENAFTIKITRCIRKLYDEKKFKLENFEGYKEEVFSYCSAKSNIFNETFEKINTIILNTKESTEKKLENINDILKLVEDDKIIDGIIDKTAKEVTPQGEQVTEGTKILIRDYCKHEIEGIENIKKNIKENNENKIGLIKEQIEKEKGIQNNLDIIISEIRKFEGYIKAINKIKNKNEIIKEDDKNKNVLEFIKEIIQSPEIYGKLTENIIESFFDSISTEEEEKDFLQFLEKNKDLLLNNIHLRNCFVKNIDKFYKYPTVLSDILIDRSDVVQDIILSDKFNNFKDQNFDFRYHYTYRIFAENMINSALNCNLNSNDSNLNDLIKNKDKNKTEERKKGDNLKETIESFQKNKTKCKVAKFFLIKRYYELKDKKNENENENAIFSNIKNFLGFEGEISKEKEKILGLYGYEEGNFVLDDVDKATDLIYLGIIEYDDIKKNKENIEEKDKENIEKIIENVFKSIDGECIQKYYFNKKIIEFIDKYIEENKKSINTEFLKKVNIGLNHSVIIDLEYLELKEFNKLKLKILNNCLESEKSYKEENVDKNFKEGLAEIITKIEDGKEINEEEIEEIELLGNDDNYKNFPIFYKNAFKRLWNFVDEKRKLIKKENNKNNTISILDLKDNDTDNIKPLKDVYNNKDSIIKDENLSKLIKEYIEKTLFTDKNEYDSSTIEFKRKTEGCSTGFYAIIRDNNKKEVKRIYVKKEQTVDQKPKEISKLLNENISVKIYRQKINDTDHFILTEGIGEKGLEDKDFEKDNYFTIKNKENDEYTKNFLDSFTEIFVKGYLLQVQDIRCDNIRVGKDGKCYLIDWVHSMNVNRFTTRIGFIDPAYILNTSETDEIKNLFDGLFFQSQIDGQTMQPKHDGTKQIFEKALKVYLEVYGKENFKTILINKINSSFVRVVENYFNMTNEEKESSKDLIDSCYEKYNELYNAIKMYCPKISEGIKSPNEVFFEYTIIKLKENNKITDEEKEKLENFRNSGEDLNEEIKEIIGKTITELKELGLTDKLREEFYNEICVNYKNKLNYFEIIKKVYDKTTDKEKCAVYFDKVNSILDEINGNKNYSISKNVYEKEQKLINENKNKDIKDIKDIKNINDFSQEFLEPNEKEGYKSKYKIDFPTGIDIMELIKNKELKTNIYKIGEEDSYNIIFKCDKNMELPSLVDFIQAMRIMGIVKGCESLGIGISITKSGKDYKKDFDSTLDNEKINTLDNKKIERLNSLLGINTGKNKEKFEQTELGKLEKKYINFDKGGIEVGGM